MIPNPAIQFDLRRLSPMTCIRLPRPRSWAKDSACKNPCTNADARSASCRDAYVRERMTPGRMQRRMAMMASPYRDWTAFVVAERTAGGFEIPVGARGAIRVRLDYDSKATW